MSTPFVTLIIFNCGLAVGIFVTVVLHQRLDDRRISTALDTIGIRRKEFRHLDDQVTDLGRSLALQAHRLTLMEELKVDAD